MSEKMDKKHWRGIKYNINLCCILFFTCEWKAIRKYNLYDYDTMDILTDRYGIVLCPSCISRKINI